MSLATLAQAKAEMKATSTTDDAVLLTYLNQTTARIHEKGLWFEPVKRTEYLPIRDDLIRTDMRLYRLPRYAVALNSVTVYGTALTLSTVVKGWPSTTTAFEFLQLVSTSGDWYGSYYDSAYDPLITVNADWGYHSNLPVAWQSEDTIQDVGGINATVTSVTVADADGTNWELVTPRFSPGQLLRIGTEFIRVTAVNTTTNILTIQRGVNGSTAAIHAKDTAIYTWNPTPDIVRLCARGAAFLYAKRDSFEQPGGFGSVSYPTDWLNEMRGIIQEYMNR